jgi:hypothetical protein
LSVPGEPGRAYRDLFTDRQIVAERGELELAEIFGEFPVAALLTD